MTDVIKIVGEGINDLKNKFLAFDGIGSVLAGGALAVGLKKIYNLAMKVKDVIQGIPKNLPGGTPTGGNGLPSTSSVKDMVVTATNVIINSKGAPTRRLLQHHRQTHRFRSQKGLPKGLRNQDGVPGSAAGRKGCHGLVGYRIRWNRS